MTGKRPKRNFINVITYEGVLFISISTSKIPWTFTFEMSILNKSNRMSRQK
jgi:hypothetical protein